MQTPCRSYWLESRRCRSRRSPNTGVKSGALARPLPVTLVLATLPSGSKYASHIQITSSTAVCAKWPALP